MHNASAVTTLMSDEQRHTMATAARRRTRLVVVLHGDALVWVQHDKFHLDIIRPAQPMKTLSNPDGYKSCQPDTCAVAL